MEQKPMVFALEEWNRKREADVRMKTTKLGKDNGVRRRERIAERKRTETAC